jgi:phenylalanine-4-hydroxylase
MPGSPSPVENAPEWSKSGDRALWESSSRGEHVHAPGAREDAVTKVDPHLDVRTKAPLPPDFVVAQRPEDYTSQDHGTWRTLSARQTALLHGRAVDEFFAGIERLNIAADRIPDFADINRVLAKTTGWTVVAVPGLVPDEVFFGHLAERRFPAGYWIRKPEQLDYIEEPDVFHDVFGHVPLLMQQRYADYMQAYGRAGRAFAGTPALANLARLYWYTVEFGLMQTACGLRIFGAGLISSAGEAVHALESRAPARVRFDCERVMRSRYEIDRYQRIYFVLAGYEDLPALRRDELRGFIELARRKADLAPGQLIDTDSPVDVAAAASAR